MPVDMSIPNSIIQAFMAGRQNRQSREDAEFEKEKFKVQKEQEEARLKQQQEQFKAEHELVTKKFDLDKASHALNMLTQRQNLGKDITESGNVPPGIKNLTPPKYISSDLGESMTLDSPELGGIFKVPSHEKFVQDRLNEAIQLAEAKEAPARRTELLKQRQQLYNTGIENKLNRESREEVARIGAQSRLDAARARGTSESKARLANTFSQQFNTDKVVQNFDIIKNYTDFANQLDLSSGADDIGLVYAYSKVLDPNRVTASEFDSAQKYAQTIANRYKVDLERLSSNQGDFLSPTARQSMLKVINDAYKINKAAYDNIKKQHEKKFANIGEDPNDWLGDRVGDDIVTMPDGKKIKITKRYPDGSFDGEEVK